MERSRDLFEQCLENCPAKFAKSEYTVPVIDKNCVLKSILYKVFCMFKNINFTTTSKDISIERFENVC